MMETNMSRSLRLIFSGGMVMGIGMLAQPAFSQTTTDTSITSSTTTPVQRVEITGSSIRRVDTETPSPVQVISAEDLKKSGYTSIAQVLQNVTANGQGTLSSGFSGAFAAGAEGVSLRGLTTGATLVLIDGHRMAPNALSDDGQRSFVDISNIPFDTIERVEILKDGASAIYGSDAMAGVVNVILKKNFVGTTMNAEGGTSTQGGGATAHLSVTSGFGNLDDDGYNAFASVEFRHENEITDASRAGNSSNGGWTTTNWTNFGGLNWTPGAVNSYVAYPKIPGSTYLVSPTTGAIDVLSGSCTAAQITSSSCTYKDPGAIQPESQNLNLLASFTKRLSDGWQLAVKATFFQSKVDVISSGLGASYGSNPYTYNANVAVSAGVSPYQSSLGSVGPITVPANYPGNTLGTSAIVIGADSSSPTVEDKVDSKNYRLAFDLTGSIGEWDTLTAVGLTRNTVDQDFQGTQNVYALNAALNRATNPYSLTGANSAADIAAIYPSVTSHDVSDLNYVEFHASRSIMQLSGGDLGFSTGASYVWRSMQSPAPALVAEGVVYGNNAFVSGTQTDAALFAELAAPLTKTFELDAAARYDHFGDIGENNSVTPKTGFKWTPNNVFALRGTLSTGFRAPNPAEAGESGQSYVGSGVDNTLCPGGLTATNGHPAAGSFIAACTQPIVLNTSNHNLKPEKSDSETLGVILEPIKGWSSTIDLYQIKIKDQIVTPGTVNQANAVRSSTDSSGLCADGKGGTYSCTSSEGLILYIPNEYINANSTTTSGIELETHYKFGLGNYGSLLTSLDWSHMMSYVLDADGVSYQLAGTHGPSIIGGNTGNPKDRIQATLTWDKGPWDVTTALNYVGGYSVVDPSYEGGSTCATALAAVQGYPYFPGGNAPSSYCQIGSFMTTDLTVRYKVSKQLVVHAAMNNVFDRQPPTDLSTYGGGLYPFNPSLHMSGAIGRFVQAGLTYSF